MPPPPVHRRIELPVGPTARLAVVADTHSEPHPAAHERLSALRPDAILHGGDIGDLRVLDGLSAIAPVLAVRGNIDTRAPAVPDSIAIDVIGSDAGLLRIFLTHIAVAGPRLRADVARLARDEGAGLVVCGHSHVPFIGQDRGIPMFNPGSIGPRRFSLPILFGTIDLGADGVHLSHWSCETGERWSPPQ